MVSAGARGAVSPAIRIAQPQLRKGGYVLHRDGAVVFSDPARDVRCDNPPLGRHHLSPVVRGPRDPDLTRITAAFDLAAIMPDPPKETVRPAMRRIPQSPNRSVEHPVPRCQRLVPDKQHGHPGETEQVPPERETPRGRLADHPSQREVGRPMIGVATADIG